MYFCHRPIRLQNCSIRRLCSCCCCCCCRSSSSRNPFLCKTSPSPRPRRFQNEIRLLPATSVLVLLVRLLTLPHYRRTNLTLRHLLFMSTTRNHSEPHT
ncbi:hypothetical protein BCV70DRAFT_53627 [Testicularia cyperi]|uniref:Uncharacterized protein n=1 Tax=Testicularia cyperi TaxID=1882483 RepID=A0A317XVM4_9BASI|nr:hypothetical protein BCV70DRAFT_53627 [Testicularia cyperi]